MILETLPSSLPSPPPEKKKTSQLSLWAGQPGEQCCHVVRSQRPKLQGSQRAMGKPVL